MGALLTPTLMSQANSLWLLLLSLCLLLRVMPLLLFLLLAIIRFNTYQDKDVQTYVFLTQRKQTTGDPIQKALPATLINLPHLTAGFCSWLTQLYIQISYILVSEALVDHSHMIDKLR